MNDAIRNLCGSEHRDLWRLAHKQIAETYPEAEYWSGSDGDFFLIQSHIPIALIDIKHEKEKDDITPAEKALYVWCIRRGCPVYISRGESLWTSNVYQYDVMGAETFVSDNYIGWEREFRKEMEDKQF